ncbi:MAG: LytTR family transcriptional regulator [Bacteroidales bacterium]|nr:LytTR family transcriptional regulator [Clostridium sp.]MCM1204108.1 LytTR family transcriptional regulator [Bacteroidales bacterium]
MDNLEYTLDECMEDILKEIRKEERTVCFPFVEGETTLKTDDIIYIETNKHRNLFYTKQGTYSIYRKLNEIEEDLAGMDFLRIHQSFLVNMRYVGKISSYIMKLTTGEELSVPKSRYQYVKQEYALYRGDK